MGKDGPEEEERRGSICACTREQVGRCEGISECVLF